MGKTLTEMVQEIVTAQASHSKMSADDLDETIRRTFTALKEIKASEEGAEPSEEKKEEDDELATLRANPMLSIKRDHIISLEDGSKHRQLTANHLKRFGLTPREYKRKWGFSLKQPLSAKSLTAARRKSAKKRGLPKKLKEYIRGRQRAAAEPK